MKNPQGGHLRRRREAPGSNRRRRALVRDRPEQSGRERASGRPATGWEQRETAAPTHGPPRWRRHRSGGEPRRGNKTQGRNRRSGSCNTLSRRTGLVGGASPWSRPPRLRKQRGGGEGAEVTGRRFEASRRGPEIHRRPSVSAKRRRALLERAANERTQRRGGRPTLETSLGGGSYRSPGRLRRRQREPESPDPNEALVSDHEEPEPTGPTGRRLPAACGRMIRGPQPTPRGRKTEEGRGIDTHRA